MASIVSSLKTEEEVRLQSLFSSCVRFHLLYKSSHHGATMKELFNRFDNDGKYLLILFPTSGSIRGIFMSKPLKDGQQFTDEKVFLFKKNYGYVRFPDSKTHTAISVSAGSDSITFGQGVRLTLAEGGWNVTFCKDVVFKMTAYEENLLCTDVELHRVQDICDILPNPWRAVSWSDKTRENLRKDFVAYKLESLPQVKALLLGPVGSGKSSLINSIRSTMFQRVTHMPNIGTAVEGFTQKMKTYDIRVSQRGSPSALSFCDVMPIGGNDFTGLSHTDALAVVKGHVPEGYQFQRDVTISDKVSGYIANPTLTEQVHCVLFVLDATKVTTYPSSLESTLKKLHATISDLGIPQLILLTHVDQVCLTVQDDLKNVYSTQSVRDKMQKAGELVGLPLSHVLPVKNYVSQLSVDCNTDILLLSAAMGILLAVDDTFNDQYPNPVSVDKISTNSPTLIPVFPAACSSLPQPVQL